MNSRLPIAAGCLLILSGSFHAGCSDSGETTRQSSPPVGVLQAADYRVTLHTGPEGPLYSIQDADGRQLAREIDADRMAAEFPRIHDEVTRLLADRKSWWAGNEAGQDPVPNRAGR